MGRLVHGLGPLGVEGPFRRSCEWTMRVLRQEDDVADGITVVRA